MTLKVSTPTLIYNGDEAHQCTGDDSNWDKTATVVGDKVLLSSKMQYVVVFDAKSDTWFQIAGPRIGEWRSGGKRGYSVTSIGNDRALFWGVIYFSYDGSPNPQRTNTGLVLDLKTQKWLDIVGPSPLSPRNHHLATEVNGRILVWGGRQDTLSSNSSSYAFDGAIFDASEDFDQWKPIALSSCKLQ